MSNLLDFYPASCYSYYVVGRERRIVKPDVTKIGDVNIGNLVRLRDDYSFQNVYGFGVVTEVTQRVMGRPTRVAVKWQRTAAVRSYDIFALRVVS